jgi:hypothetical protein
MLPVEPREWWRRRIGETANFVCLRFQLFEQGDQMILQGPVLLYAGLDQPTVFDQRSGTPRSSRINSSFRSNLKSPFPCE